MKRVKHEVSGKKISNLQYIVFLMIYYFCRLISTPFAYGFKFGSSLSNGNTLLTLSGEGGTDLDGFCHHHCHVVRWQSDLKLKNTQMVAIILSK